MRVSSSILALAALVVAAAANTPIRREEFKQAEVDEMVNNVLQWLQGVYKENNRKARQYFGSSPIKPRPFERTYLPPTGYPPAGSKPTPSYSEGPSAPTSSPPSYQPSQPSSFQPIQPTYQPSKPSQPAYQPSQPSRPSYQPSQPNEPPYPPASQPSYQPTSPNPPPYQPSSPSQPPYQPSSPSQPPYQPSSPNQPTYNPSSPSQPPYQPSSPSQPPYQPSSPSQPPYQPSSPSQPPYQPSSPSQPPYQPSSPSQPPYQPSSPSQPPYQPSSPSQPPPQPSSPSQPSYQPSSPNQPTYQPSQPNTEPTLPPYETSETDQPSATFPPFVSSQTPITSAPSNPDDDRHPPHVHAITVDCGKEMMTINIEFNKPYNGLIYSQDHFKDSECVYVRENSNQIKFSFTVSLNKCGTKFFSDFENEGQAYLENVLVLQNEAGIQEVWDHIRRVRCLWEGNLTKQLVSSLSVGMLSTEINNFSGDTAMARLDIQVGKGPFAPEANGLVKIGETMTLVISVTGDPGFDIQVKECVARDANSQNVVPLTDKDGCILKPKLFGAFQKTRETGNTGASILAFAYFNAFKFPDEMDLVIQCDVELCKTDCDMCPNPGSLEPSKRRKREITVGNTTFIPEPVTVGKGLKVIFAEDLASPPQNHDICMTYTGAAWATVFVLLVAAASSASASFIWVKAKNSTNKHI